MKLLIHDLSEEALLKILPDAGNEFGKIVYPQQPIRQCTGCFGCWIKTPGACVIKDDYGELGQLFARCEEVLLISRCVYGGFSPFVKNVLDRSIGYMHPDFVIKNGEMHHKRRYSNSFKLQVWFYGECTASERETAQKLVQANALNLDCEIKEIKFLTGLQVRRDCNESGLN